MTTPGHGGEQGLPTHQDEIMASHEGQPSISVQSATHGAPLPAADLGESEAVKYGTSSPVC
jgi:hypothetical protein